MKLKDQVCTLEQAKRLRELGIVQDSLFYWNWYILGKEPELTTDKYDESQTLTNSRQVSAFTVSELGMLLPPHFPSSVHDTGAACHCISSRVDTFPLLGGDTEYDTTPAHILNKELVPLQGGRTEAEARASMLIHLIQEGIVTAESCNNRFLEF